MPLETSNIFMCQIDLIYSITKMGLEQPTKTTNYIKHYKQALSAFVF
jgi:hypothetical protein